MKKKLNIIQIKGIKGLILAIGIVSCLIAGFIAFPGWVGMNIWNYLATYLRIPSIGLVQGILLWGIIYLTYSLIKKDKLIICMKSPQGLSEEDLKAVFEDVKRQSKEDPVLKAMLKAREAELKYKAQENFETKDNEQISSTDNSNL